MHRHTILLFFLLTPCCVCSLLAQPANTLLPTALKPYGRYLFNNRQELELISSAVHTGFSYKGTECRVYAAASSAGTHTYLQYEVDGVYRGRVKISDSINQPLLIKTNKGGIHTVWLYKTTEAHSGALIVKKITGKKIQALRKEPLPVIEFIGNSITCGAAADTSAMPCNAGQYHDHHNAYDAYGPRVARALGVEWVLSSVSGIGVYRNWNSDGPTMPQVYEKVDFQAGSHTPWNFDLFTPSIVSIALGTNDFSKGDGIKTRLPFDSAAFANRYIAFVETVGHYYPLAQIVLLSSPMLNGSDRTLLQNCLTAVKQKVDSLHPTGKPVALYFFKPMQAHGCIGHPSVADHAVMAEELVPVFRNLLQQVQQNPLR